MDSIRADCRRADRLLAFARAASLTTVDASDARLARSLYAQALEELARSTPDASPGWMPSKAELDQADSPERHRALLDECDAACREVLAFVRKRLRPFYGLHVRRAVWLALVLLLVAGAKEVLRPELAAGKPWRVSSMLDDHPTFGAQFMRAHVTWDGIAIRPFEIEPPSIQFHTDEDSSPWFELDLLQRHRLHSFEIENRRDCCADRAVPLVVEVSDDRRAWTEVARRDTLFAVWSGRLEGVTARWVRVRVDRKSFLHLERVSLW
jgi:hypothetical protein